MNGNIPVLFVKGQSLAEAWEESLVSLYEHGCDIKTEYDKPEDPPSKDCSMTIIVQDPLAEPMIHRDMPGGLKDLQEYVLEVLDGIKDHCVRSAADDADDAPAGNQGAKTMPPDLVEFRKEQLVVVQVS